MEAIPELGLQHDCYRVRPVFPLNGRWPAIHLSISSGSNLTNFPIFRNGTRRCSTRRRTKRGVTPRRAANCSLFIKATFVIGTGKATSTECDRLEYSAWILA